MVFIKKYSPPQDVGVTRAVRPLREVLLKEIFALKWENEVTSHVSKIAEIRLQLSHSKSVFSEKCEVHGKRKCLEFSFKFGYEFPPNQY